MDIAPKFHIHDVVSAFCEEYEKHLEAVIVALRKDDTEAYIHFLKQDKRLDRWVSVSEICRILDPNQHDKDDRVLTRNQRKLIDEENIEDLPIEIQPFERAHQEVTKVRNIDSITIGQYTIKSWYYSPYPLPYGAMDHLYICEHCFRYFASAKDLQMHLQMTGELHPPGNEIYREGNISIFEIKGWIDKITCQCLCLLSKLFLDHKTLFYDVEGFLFYVVCECDEKGAHIAAYFSKEVNSAVGNILSCITTLPPYQKKGYGNLCISLSYELAKRSRVSGGPERPLSDLGKIAFHAYWRDVILDLFKTRYEEITTLDNIVMLTGIDKNDIVETLKEFNCVTKAKGEYELSIDIPHLTAALSAYQHSTPKRKIDPRYLIWLPEQ